MAGPATATTTGRPLRGKSFYLDVPSGRAARDLAAAIRHLGGVSGTGTGTGTCPAAPLLAAGARWGSPPGGCRCLRAG